MNVNYMGDEGFRHINNLLELYATAQVYAKAYREVEKIEAFLNLNPIFFYNKNFLTD